MVKALLADRFKLVLHRESKELSVFRLVVAKNGPKLRETEEGDDPTGYIQLGRGTLRAASLPMAEFAQILSIVVGGTVIDRTELMGYYDFTLDWKPDSFRAGPEGERPLPADPDGPSIFTALQEHLGLKLEAYKGPVEMLIVDHGEKPSEN